MYVVRPRDVIPLARSGITDYGDLLSSNGEVPYYLDDVKSTTYDS